MNKKTFVFLGGLHRSGTSLLHDIIRSHDRISGFYDTGVPGDEGQHLQSVYPPAAAFGGPGKFGFDNRSFMDESHPVATVESADNLFSQWSKYWDMSRELLVEKSPPNLVRTRFLQKLFPTSVFIVIFRHPIAIAYATQKWSDTSVRSLIRHTLLCYERFLADLPFLGKSLVIRYEELVKEPHRAVDGIFEFLGLDRIDFRGEIRADVNERYFRRWREDCRHAVTRLFVRPRKSAERRIERLGYSLKNPDEVLRAVFDGPHFHPPRCVC